MPSFADPDSLEGVLAEADPVFSTPYDQFEMPRGLPRPIFKGRPVPYSADTPPVHLCALTFALPYFSGYNVQRMSDCRLGLLCLVCGEQVDPEAVAVIVDETR